MITNQNETKLVGFVSTEPCKVSFEDGRRYLYFKLQTNIEVCNKQNEKRVYKEQQPIILWNALCDVNEKLQVNDVVCISGRNHWKNLQGLDFCEVIADNCYKMK